MGIGWIQVDNNNQTINSFSAKIQFWPSSYKAELFLIITAISTAPRNSIVNIFTDSQSVISKFNNLQLNLSHSNKLFKFNSWPIWHTLLNIIKSHKLQIIFHKVQAHSDNNLNEQADSLAKQHPSSALLSFNYTNLYNPYHILQWEQHYVELPTRYFIKQICKAYILAMWASQKCNSEWSYFNQDIDWRSTWLYFNHNQKPSYNITNFRLNQLKSFKIKILLNELPTYQLFQTIYPNQYPDTNCFHCNLANSHSHWRTCANTLLLNQIIQTSTNQIIFNKLPDLDTHQKNNLIHKIIHHPALNPLYILSNTLYPNLTLKGLIPKSLITTVQNFDISYKTASEVIIDILLNINEQSYEQLWKTYCILFSNWKKQQNSPQSQPINKPSTSSNLTTRHTRSRRIYTYSCLCGLPDQLHTHSNTCPPIGQAIRKINIWSILWIKYSISSNYILNIQI